MICCLYGNKHLHYKVMYVNVSLEHSVFLGTERFAFGIDLLFILTR